MKLTFLFCALVLAMVAPSSSWAWDHVYDGSVLPNDASLANRWAVGGTGGGIAMCSTDGDVLCINDTRTDTCVFFSKGAQPGPITMESGVRVATVSGQCVSMAVGTASFSTAVNLYPGYLQVFFDYGNPPVTYSADLTAFHALRVAINAQGQSYVWLDQTLIAQGATHVGGQGGIYFGGTSVGGLGQSYWDYVAYSASFDPVPEPSSLASLCVGLLPLPFAMKRPRRNKT